MTQIFFQFVLNEWRHFFQSHSKEFLFPFVPDVLCPVKVEKSYKRRKKYEAKSRESKENLTFRKNKMPSLSVSHYSHYFPLPIQPYFVYISHCQSNDFIYIGPIAAHEH